MPFRDSWIVVGLLLIFAGFGAEQPIIGIIGTLVLVLGWVARHWSKHVFDRVELSREPSERRAFIGEQIGVDFTLVNKKPLPMPWYEWRFALGEPLPVEGEILGAAAVPAVRDRSRSAAFRSSARRSTDHPPTVPSWEGTVGVRRPCSRALPSSQCVGLSDVKDAWREIPNT